MRYIINRTYPSLFDFDNFFNDFFASSTQDKFPPVDVYETKDSYVLEAEVAGYNEESIKVLCNHKVLTISSDGVESPKEEYIAKEICLPAFQRSFQLPDDADEDGMSASSKNGILTVVINKMKKAEPKRIEVKIN